jgi:alkylation response protein AidB-like acyl-CoA dehydrogenase
LHLALTEEESALHDLFAEFFDEQCPATLVRASAPLGFDQGLWIRLLETGAPGLGVSEPNDGSGAGIAELAVVVEQLGRRIAPLPLLDHFVATRALERAGALDVLATAVTGDDIAGFSVRPGEKAPLVPAGAVARYVVGVAPSGDLVMLDSTPENEALPNMAGLPLARRSFDGDARVLATGDSAHSQYAIALAEWQLLMASALVGLSEFALEEVVAYVKVRHQFGVPIGSFQALQHGLAELRGPLDGARLLAAKAAWQLDNGDDAGIATASMAYLFATETSQIVTSRAMHYEGGYGLMTENDLELYYRRAKGWPLVAGDRSLEYRRLGAVLYPKPVLSPGIGA